MEKLESQSKINDAINQSVKEEEQRVIEAANRRMAEVHAKKAQEADAAAKAIEKAHHDREAKELQARREEEDAINSALRKHSSNVVAQ